MKLSSGHNLIEFYTFKHKSLLECFLTVEYSAEEQNHRQKGLEICKIYWLLFRFDLISTGFLVRDQ